MVWGRRGLLVARIEAEIIFRNHCTKDENEKEEINYPLSEFKLINLSKCSSDSLQLHKFDIKIIKRIHVKCE